MSDTEISVHTVGTDSVTIQWTGPSTTEMSGYRATIAELSTDPQTLDSFATSAEFTGLTPGEPYTFSIIVDSSDQSSEATTYYFYTGKTLLKRNDYLFLRYDWLWIINCLLN